METNSFLIEEELVDMQDVAEQYFPIEANLFRTVRKRPEYYWRTIVPSARDVRVERAMAEIEERPPTRDNILRSWLPFPYPASKDPSCPQEVPALWDQLWACFTGSAKQAHRELALRRILGLPVNDSIARLVVSRHAIDELRRNVRGGPRLRKIDPGMWAYMVHYAPRFYVDPHVERQKERDQMDDMVLSQILRARVAPRVSLEALRDRSNFYGFIYSRKLSNSPVKLGTFEEWFDELWNQYRNPGNARIAGSDLTQRFTSKHWRFMENYVRAKVRAIYDHWDSIQERSCWRNSIDSWLDAMVPSNDPKGPPRNSYGLFPEDSLGPLLWPIAMAGVDPVEAADQYDTKKRKVLYVPSQILDQSGYPNQFLRFARFCEFKSALPRSPANRFAWDNENTAQPGTAETRGRGMPLDIGAEGSLANREKHFEAFTAQLSRVMMRAYNICMSEYARIKLLTELGVYPDWYEDIPEFGDTPENRRSPPLVVIANWWLRLADQLRNDVEYKVPISTRVPYEKESKFPKNTLNYHEIGMGDFPRPLVVPLEVWEYAEKQAGKANPLAVLFWDAIDAVLSTYKEYKHTLGYLDFPREYTRESFKATVPFCRPLYQLVRQAKYLVPARQREVRRTRSTDRARTPKVDSQSLYHDLLQWEEEAWAQGMLKRDGWGRIRYHQICTVVDPVVGAGALPINLRRHTFDQLGLGTDERLEPMGTVSEPSVGRVIFVTDGLAKYVAAVAANTWLLTLPFTQLHKMIEIVSDPTIPLSIREGCRFEPCTNDIFVFVYGTDRVFETDFNRTFDLMGSPIFRREGKEEFLCTERDVRAFKKFRRKFPLTFLALPLVDDRRVQPFRSTVAEECLRLNNECWRKFLPASAILDPNDLGVVPPSIDRKTDPLRMPRDETVRPPGAWKESVTNDPLREVSSRGMAEIYLNPRGSRGYFQILLWKLEVAAQRPSGCLLWRGVGGNQYPRVFLGAYPHNNRVNSLTEVEPEWMFPTSLACNNHFVLPSGRWALLGDNAFHVDHLEVPFDP